MARRVRLTAFSRLLITIAVVMAAFYGIRYLTQQTDILDQFKNKPTNEQDKQDQKTTPPDKDVIKIAVTTSGAYAAGEYINSGFDPSPNSRFLKEYGISVAFKIMDDVPASRKAWKKDKVNLLWCTIDALPAEIADLKDYDPVVIFQTAWSRGGDAIVVRRGINTVNDLRGKRIAVAEKTASHAFLLWLLEAGGLSQNDVEIIPQPSPIEAATAFKSRQVDAAVVWSPDDVAAVNAIPGARVLQSTKSASHIIAHALLAKRAWAKAHTIQLTKLYKAWMTGAAEINNNPDARRHAAKILAENFPGFTEEMTQNAIANFRLTTHGDNINFFGLNPRYRGVKGEELYTRMANTYRRLGLAKAHIPNWRQIAFDRIVRKAKLDTQPSQHAEKTNNFTTNNNKKAEKERPVAIKRISIAFRPGEYQLDENAKYIIDKEFADIAKAFSNARIRIEGNTDNTGPREANIKLSRLRAQAVADYLSKTYDMPPNRFIVIGNGPDKPIAPNDTPEGRAKNRRTEFQIIRM